MAEDTPAPWATARREKLAALVGDVLRGRVGGRRGRVLRTAVGWRTRFDLLSPIELVITAWNVTPAGDEAKATEATYHR